MSIENSKTQRDELLKLIDSVCEKGYSFEFSLDGGGDRAIIQFVKDFEPTRKNLIEIAESARKGDSGGEFVEV